MQKFLLHVTEMAPDVASNKTPVVFLHGLLGSSTNFNRLQNAFAKSRQTYSLDLRNHGRSMHSANVHDIDDLCSDVTHTLDTLIPSHSQFTIIGHSLGGKVAMRLAQRRPTSVSKLVALDILPKSYKTSNKGWLGVTEAVAAASSVSLVGCATRKDVENRLKSQGLQDAGWRSFVCQNLVPVVGGGFKWRVCWPGITSSLHHYADWPQIENSVCTTEMHLLRGAGSPFVSDMDIDHVKVLFPSAKDHVLKGGHFFHAESHQECLDVLSQIL